MRIIKSERAMVVHMPHGKDGGNQVSRDAIRDIISLMKDVKDIKDKR